MSTLAHIFLVLGISFVMPSSSQERSFSPPLKITLVAPAPDQDKPNPDAKTLAQTNNQGEEDASQFVPLAVTEQQKSQESTDSNALTAKSDSAKQTLKTAKAEDKQPQQSREEITAGINLAYLNAQAKPREKFVSANTKESLFAAYIEKWRQSVEKVGNLNYPDAAKAQKLEGSLVLDVTLKPDGNIDAVKLLRSSGHKVLDDGAERIVHLSAPFATFTKDMAAEIDKLHIIRTWKFGRNRVTSSSEIK